jgi:hypothetical protein
MRTALPAIHSHVSSRLRYHSSTASVVQTARPARMSSQPMHGVPYAATFRTVHHGPHGPSHGADEREFSRAFGALRQVFGNARGLRSVQLGIGVGPEQFVRVRVHVMSSRPMPRSTSAVLSAARA